MKNKANKAKMKKIKQAFFLSFLFIFFVAFSFNFTKALSQIAQLCDPCRPESYNQKECFSLLYNEKNYQTECFYKYCNYSLIPASDWEKIDQKRIDHNWYLHTMGCQNCEITVGPDIKEIKFSHEGIDFQSQAGKFHITPKIYPSNSSFEVDNSSYFAILFSLPKNKVVFFSADQSENDRVEVCSSFLFCKLLEFKDGKIYFVGKEYEKIQLINVKGEIIAAEAETTISSVDNKLTISGKFFLPSEIKEGNLVFEGKNINLYFKPAEFNPLKHTNENFLVITPKSLFVGGDVSFYSDNFFGQNEKVKFRVEKGSFMSLDSSFGNTIGVRHHGNVVIQNGQFKIKLGDHVVIKKLHLLGLGGAPKPIDLFISSGGKEYRFFKDTNEFVELTKLNHFENYYSRVIDGLPVIPFHGAYEYGKVGKKLERVYLYEIGRDIIDLTKLHGEELPVISEAQQCADTQVIIYAYALKKLYDAGEIDTIKIGKWVWDKKTNYKDWVEMLMRDYINTGWLRKNLKVINLEEAMPGDIITLHPDSSSGYGHTMGIKEVYVDNKGKKYFRIFAGSDPAIDPRIYPALFTEDYLDAMIKSGEAIITRWPNPPLARRLARR
ncbi:MAG: hypothetical protein QW199_03120 [Candidatus Pacearchaeota archaeon]